MKPGSLTAAIPWSKFHRERLRAATNLSLARRGVAMMLVELDEEPIPLAPDQLGLVLGHLYGALMQAYDTAEVYEQTWKRLCRRSTLVFQTGGLTPERAQNIIRAAKMRPGIGPWVDHLDASMTEAEKLEVKRVWATLPGEYSFLDALQYIAEGKAKP